MRDLRKLVVRVILESAAIMIGVIGIVMLMGYAISRTAPPVSSVILICSACAGLLLVAELYAMHRRGWAVRRPSAILVITALLITAALGVALMPVHAYPVEGSFHYEYRTRSYISFGPGNQTEPIDVNTTATLGVRVLLTYGILEEELATCDLIVDDHNDGVFLELNGDYGPQVFAISTYFVKAPFKYVLSLSDIVEYLTEQGITDGLHNLTFTSHIIHFSINVPGLPKTHLWCTDWGQHTDFVHTLLTVRLNMTDGTITRISYDDQPLETTKTVLLYNPAVRAAKEWIPPALLVAALLVQTVAYAAPHRRRIHALLKGD